MKLDLHKKSCAITQSIYEAIAANSTLVERLLAAAHYDNPLNIEELIVDYFEGEYGIHCDSLDKFIAENCSKLEADIIKEHLVLADALDKCGLALTNLKDALDKAASG